MKNLLSSLEYSQKKHFSLEKTANLKLLYILRKEYIEYNTIQKFIFEIIRSMSGMTYYSISYFLKKYDQFGKLLQTKFFDGNLINTSKCSLYNTL